LIDPIAESMIEQARNKNLIRLKLQFTLNEFSIFFLRFNLFDFFFLSPQDFSFPAILSFLVRLMFSRLCAFTFRFFLLHWILFFLLFLLFLLFPLFRNLLRKKVEESLSEKRDS
jgi:hypothetical protein